MKDKISAKELHMEYIRAELVQPNPWNPNRLNKEQERALRQSIMHKGFVDPVSVRTVPGGFQIVDGEQRWRILNLIRAQWKQGDLIPVRKEFGYALNEVSEDLVPLLEDGTVAVVHLGELDEKVAKQLTLIYNRTHGDHDPLGEAKILKELVDALGAEAALDGLPFTMKELESSLEVAAFDWERYLDAQEPTSEIDNPTEEDDWVTMTVTLTKEAYEVYTRLREHLVEERNMPVPTKRRRPNAAEVNGAVIARLCSSWKK